MQNNKLRTAAALIGAIVTITMAGVSLFGVYVTLPERVSQVEAKGEIRQHDIEEMKITLARVEERIIALQAMLQDQQRRLPPPRPLGPTRQDQP